MSDTTTKHKLPWQVMKGRNALDISDADGFPICIMVGDEEECQYVAHEIVNIRNSHQALIDALHMAKHIVAQEGTDEQAEQVFRALELAGEKP